MSGGHDVTPTVLTSADPGLLVDQINEASAARAAAVQLLTQFI